MEAILTGITIGMIGILILEVTGYMDIIAQWLNDKGIL